MLGAEQPARPRRGAVALWEGRDSPDAPALLGGSPGHVVSRQKPGLPGQPVLICLEQKPPSGVRPAMAYLLLTCVMLQHSIKWTLDSCLLPGTDVILAGL